MELAHLALWNIVRVQSFHATCQWSKDLRYKRRDLLLLGATVENSDGFSNVNAEINQLHHSAHRLFLTFYPMFSAG